MRTREVWIHAVDLANGATFTDIPEPVLERLLTDITGAWKVRGTGADLVVKVTDRRSHVRGHDAGLPHHGHRHPGRRRRMGSRPRHPRRHRHTGQRVPCRSAGGPEMDLIRRYAMG